MKHVLCRENELSCIRQIKELRDVDRWQRTGHDSLFDESKANVFLNRDTPQIQILLQLSVDRHLHKSLLIKLIKVICSQPNRFLKRGRSGIEKSPRDNC